MNLMSAPESEQIRGCVGRRARGEEWLDMMLSWGSQQRPDWIVSFHCDKANGTT